MGAASGPGVIVTMPTAPVMPATATTVPVKNNAKNSQVLMAGEGEDSNSGLQRPLHILTTNENNNGTTNPLANTKEKTPMCLVNELARFNKIQHQYRLTNEQGPAHKKRFTVTLKLGDEEYSSEGASIKKAQHSAAADALTQTQYKHPPPKTTKNVRIGKSNITPTVELNALAMKRGEPAIYNFLEPPQTANSHTLYITPQQNYTYRGIYNQSCKRYVNYQRKPIVVYPAQDEGVLQPWEEKEHLYFEKHQLKPVPVFRPPDCHRTYGSQRYYGKGPTVAGFQPPLFVVSLRVGSREFFGEGPTAQGARHDAASKAVHQLKQLPLPEDYHCEAGQGEYAGVGGNTSTSDTTDTAELKSPISLVHELALKRNLSVGFEVVSEKGPPHMRNFTTKCIVGDKVTAGEGNGKKISKKRAAEKMLDELRMLPPCSPSVMVPSNRLNKRKQNPGKKKSRNLIKVYHQEQKADMDYGDDINPISRLIQIQQAKKEREPVYTLLEERGVPRRREFVMEVCVGAQSATGTGPNKKLAKRAAAEALLQHLGYARSSPLPNKPAMKAQEPPPLVDDKNRKGVTFQEDDKPQETSSPGGSSGRQLVPGILLMADNSATPTKNSGVNIQTTAVIAKELLNGGNSPTADALAKSHTAAAKPVQASNQAVRPKEQLMYLGELLGFQIQFSDFPKGNHSEFLSLVSLSTDPPQVCHGAGTTTDTSHDQAALKALKALAEMGLDSVTSTAKKELAAQSEAIHVMAGLSQQK